MLLVRRLMMPPKLLPWPTGPGHGTTGHAQLAFHLVQDVQRVAHFAVHLVDEGDDGRVALAADLDQAAGLASTPLAASITIRAESTAVSTR